MSIAKNSGASTSSAASGTSLTFANTVDAGTDTAMRVGAGIDGSAETITGVTFNGVALAQAITQSTATQRAEQWMLAAPDAGAAHNVVISASASASIQGGADSYDGVDQTTPWDSARNQGTQASSTNPTLTYTGATAGDYILSYCTKGSTNAPGMVASGAQTESWRVGGNGAQAGAYVPSAAAGNNTLSWTAAYTNQWNLAAITLNVAAAGGAVINPLAGLISFGGELMPAKTLIVAR